MLAFNRLGTQAYHRVEVLTPNPIPARGPAIIAPNHTSGLDPCLVQFTTRRLIHWMMAAEYVTPLTRWFFDAVRIIPVERSGDARDAVATRAALKVLADGHLLGLFPEGRISHGKAMFPLQPGIALLARRARVPVIPTYLEGSQRRKSMATALLLPQQAKVSFGSPIPPEVDSRQLLATLTATYLKLSEIS